MLTWLDSVEVIETSVASGAKFDVLYSCQLFLKLYGSVNLSFNNFKLFMRIGITVDNLVP